MAENRDKRFIDPQFHIPEGIDPEVWAYREDYYIGTDDERDGLVDEGEDSEDDGIGVVDDLTVVSQTIRRVEGERTKVVDIVVEFEEVPGATKYEFRVTKVTN